MTCQQYLNKLPNRACMQEFLGSLPTPVQKVVSDSFAVIATIVNVEKLVDQFLLTQYLVALAFLQAEITALETKYMPFQELLKELQSYYRKYQNCPGVVHMIALVQKYVQPYLDEVEKKKWNYQRMKRFIKNKFNDKQTQEFLDMLEGVKDCCDGAIYRLGP